MAKALGSGLCIMNREVRSILSDRETIFSDPRKNSSASTFLGLETTMRQDMGICGPGIQIHPLRQLVPSLRRACRRMALGQRSGLEAISCLDSFVLLMFPVKDSASSMTMEATARLLSTARL